MAEKPKPVGSGVARCLGCVLGLMLLDGLFLALGTVVKSVSGHPEGAWEHQGVPLAASWLFLFLCFNVALVAAVGRYQPGDVAGGK